MGGIIVDWIHLCNLLCVKNLSLATSTQIDYLLRHKILAPKKGLYVTSKAASKKAKKAFNRHYYYEKSVQNVEFDVEFLRDQYKHFRKKAPRTLREDFCGTGALMCEWVKDHQDNVAFGYDLDPEPVDYGKENHLSKLTPEQQGRVTYHLENVLDGKKKADVIAAFNFSYFIFKKRKELLEYFKRVRASLNDDGVFFLDLFGGPESQTLQEEETEHEGFSYIWDLDYFDAITNDCRFYIHFDVNGKRHEKAFTYEWRMWGMQELRDILEDAGFSKTYGYWEEDDDEDDGGNGNFYLSESEENCDAWVTYIAALP